MNIEIEEFGKQVVQLVRDSAIRDADIMLQREGNSPMAKRWRATGLNAGSEELVKLVIADCVDFAIFYFLEAIDEGVLNLSLGSVNGLEGNYLAGTLVNGEKNIQRNVVLMILNILAD